MSSRGAHSTPRRTRKTVRRAQFGLVFEDGETLATKLLAKLKATAALCPTPEKCAETAHVVKERVEGRFCMEAIDSERLSARSSSAATPRLRAGSPASKATHGLAGHIFGLPSLDVDYVQDTAPEDVGFGNKLERYIHIKSKMRRAVLTVPKSGIPLEMQPGDVERQLQALCRVDHPNIVAFREACEDQNSLKLVYDWVDGGPLLCHLDSFIETLREPQLAQFTREILSALAAANAFGVHHLDLCMSTIFLMSTGSFCPVKVFGLGLAGYLVPLVSRREFSKSNKHYYASPEVFYTSNVKRLSPAARHASDVWSVGAILYTLCSGRPPFGAGTIKELSGRVQRAMWSFGVEFAECSYVLKEAVEEMLKVPWRSRAPASGCLHLSFLEQCLGAKDAKLSLVAIQQLHSFLQRDHCKQTVARMLTDTGLTHTAYSKLEKMFRELDQNGDGVVSLAELKASASELGIGASHVSEVVKVLDRNGNGHLDISEFIAAVVLEQEVTEERMVKAVFNKIDRDADSRLTKKEMFVLLRQYSGSVETKDVSKFVKRLDDNGDDKVDYEEFAGMFPAVSHMEEDKESRLEKFAAFVQSYDDFRSFRESAEAWLRKLNQVEEKILHASGVKDRDVSKGYLSYEKGDLSEYEVHQLLQSVAELLQQPPGKNKSEVSQKKHADNTGAKLMGMAILAACREHSQGKAQEAKNLGEGEQEEAVPTVSALDEFTRAVRVWRRSVKDADSQSALRECLYLLIKVKSEFFWQEPVKEALSEMQRSCVNIFAEVSLRSRADLTRCYTSLSDEYSLREATMLPREDYSSVQRLPEGAWLLPVHSFKGANLNSNSTLRAMQDMALPLKLVFAWKKENGREDEQKLVHMSKLMWAGRHVKSIMADLQNLLEEVDEDFQAAAATEGRMPGVPIASQPYLKHCQGRGFADDALTPREEELEEDAPNAIEAAGVGQSSEPEGSNLEELQASVHQLAGTRRIERNKVLADQVRKQRLAELGT